jgi:hypothetical protein
MLLASELSGKQRKKKSFYVGTLATLTLPDPGKMKGNLLESSPVSEESSAEISIPVNRKLCYIIFKLVQELLFMDIVLCSITYLGIGKAFPTVTVPYFSYWKHL